ncbi:MAG: sialate O-acetylesterase [Salinivirgaceae bacterium]
MKKIYRKLIFIFSLISIVTLPTGAQVILPAIISNGMVLQRNETIKIWGWAKPGEKVTVKFIKKSYSTVTGNDGRWQITLKPMKAGGPYKMEITASNNIELTDILIGDVWVCSGQSNMTHNFGRHTERYAHEIAEANIPEIRQFYVPTTAVITSPIENIPDLKWVASTPETIMDFTVIGYFFAKKLYDQYQVPMGIINTSVGGTPIESWTSEERFKEYLEILNKIEKNKDTAWVNAINREAMLDRQADGSKKEADKGLTGTIKWYETAYKPINWNSITIPGYWEDQGLRNLDGVVWYRRELEVPASMTGMEALMKLGRIVHADELYINGNLIGNTTYEYPQRKYSVAAGILKPGKNLLVVRVTNQYGKGGFVPDKPYYLLAAGDTIDLKGDWYYKVGEVYSHDKTYKQGISAQNEPTALYNGMIAPYTHFAVRGILWYQGESNAEHPELYKKLLPNMVSDWRNQWQLGDIPFLIAQLPNFMDIDYLPTESNWALMREVQMETALNTANTGIAINIDLGEWNDIHPGNKKPVGERLALAAMRISYGEKEMVSSGPIYKSSRIEGNKIIISFDHIGSGLVSGNGEELAHFAIAGEDKKFKWGTATIINNKVVVWCDGIANPKFVRYAWADNPYFANLYNNEGLPAAPFRTDQ